MIVLTMLEVAAALVATIATIVLYALRSPWRESAVGRHLMAYMAALAAEIGALLAVGLGVAVPLWLFAIVFGAVDFVVAQRLWLLWRAQQDD